MMDTFTPTPDAVVKDRFQLVRELARGGMGSVWEAFDLQLRAPCALKFILNEESAPPDIRARFLREARAAAKLRHPRAVNVLSVDEWSGALFIAMELLSGETLFDRLSEEGALPPQEAANLVEQLASVLMAAHSMGIVHRDLKPENIWLCGNERTFVKLLDFGVAKQVADVASFAKTATGMLVGTLNYMSPEQARGRGEVDYRSDLWSLALIAVECLCGKRIYEGGPGEVIASIINGPTPSLSELYPQANPRLTTWWQRALAKQAEQRYASAEDLAKDFSGALFSAHSSTLLPSPSLSLPRLDVKASRPIVAAGGTARITPPPIDHPRADGVLENEPPKEPLVAPAEAIGVLGGTNGDAASPKRPRFVNGRGRLVLAVAALALAGWLLILRTKAPLTPPPERDRPTPSPGHLTHGSLTESVPHPSQSESKFPFNPHPGAENNPLPQVGFRDPPDEHRDAVRSAPTEPARITPSNAALNPPRSTALRRAGTPLKATRMPLEPAPPTPSRDKGQDRVGF